MSIAFIDILCKEANVKKKYTQVYSHDLQNGKKDICFVIEVAKYKSKFNFHSKLL